MSTPGSHLSSETLDLLMLSALTAEEETALNAHTQTCDTCQKRVDERLQHKAEFHQFVFPRTVASVESRAADSKKRLPGWLKLQPFLALAVAASAVVVVMQYRTSEEDAPYLGIKGDTPWTEMVVQREGSGQFVFKADVRLKPKDRLQFVVSPASYPYVLVASVDGAQKFTVYFPWDGEESAEVTVKERQTLPITIELDETPGRERLWLFFSKSPLSRQTAEEALKRGIPTTLPGVFISPMEFEKVAR